MERYLDEHRPTCRILKSAGAPGTHLTPASGALDSLVDDQGQAVADGDHVDEAHGLFAAGYSKEALSRPKHACLRHTEGARVRAATVPGSGSSVRRPFAEHWAR